MNLFEQLKTWTSENFWDKLLGFLPNLVGAILTLAVGFWLAKLAGNLLVKGLTAKNVDPAVHPFIRNVVELVIKFGIVLSALSTLGINLSSFITALGAAGVTAPSIYAQQGKCRNHAAFSTLKTIKHPL